MCWGYNVRWALTQRFSERFRWKTSTLDLCHGDGRAARDCAVAAGPHFGPLLARHSLELALTEVDGGADDGSRASRGSAAEPLLVVILGPTASGKTALSLALAERFRGEIVNCDSVAMYREFDIGTAKPSAAERGRVTHHLFDCVDPTSFITAGEYARQAQSVLGEISSRGHLPIVVGGTGLYLRALLEGLFPGPQRSEELRERLRELATLRGSNICIKFSAGLMRPRREKFMQMIRPN